MVDFKQGTPFRPDHLIAGEYPRAMTTVTVASGAALSRGAVLGRVEESGKFKLSVAAAEDGSEAPRVILADDVDATDGDVEASVYLTGQFAPSALTLGAGHTVESIFWALADVGIFITPTTEA